VLGHFKQTGNYPYRLKKKKIPSDQNTENMKIRAPYRGLSGFLVIFLRKLDIADKFLQICKEQCTCLKISK
jgi:hypothetical protein